MRLLLILLALIQPVMRAPLRHKLPIRRVFQRVVRVRRAKPVNPLAECSCEDQYTSWLSTT